MYNLFDVSSEVDSQTRYLNTLAWKSRNISSKKDHIIWIPPCCPQGAITCPLIY